MKILKSIILLLAILIIAGNSVTIAQSNIERFRNVFIRNNADINGDLDVDGTSNLDVVDIDGAVDFGSTLTLDSVAFTGPIVFGTSTSAINGTLIAHGLGTTPTVVLLSPQFTGNNISQTAYITASNATSFTVGLGYATGVLTIPTLHYMAGK